MTQSKAELTTDKQILYLVQWFAEFSDFQRADFLADHLLPIFGPFLAGKLSLTEEQTKSQVNGKEEEKLSNGLSSLDLDPTRPPSIFQCRMKLFSDWFGLWSENDRLEFLLRLRNIDSAFLSEFYRVFLHRHGINSIDQLRDQESSHKELLTRLDITEKVFESKLPEVVLNPTFAPVQQQQSSPLLSAANQNTTPDLLNDVAGAKDTGSDDDDETDAAVSNGALEEKLEQCEQPEDIPEVVLTETEAEIDPKVESPLPQQQEEQQPVEEIADVEPVQKLETPQESSPPSKKEEAEEEEEEEEGELLELSSSAESPILVGSVTTNVVAVPDLVA